MDRTDGGHSMGTFHGPTWMAMAVVAYAISNVAHEGLGHGGACLLVHGRPQIITSLHFGWDESGVTEGGRRLVAAGGTIVNLLVGALALLVLRTWRGGLHGRLFLWLLASINLFQAAGYGLFSGIGNIGDWATVVEGWHPAWAWRAGLALLGGLAYTGVALLSARLLAPALGRERRIARARKMTGMAYLTGGLLYCSSGLFNPVGSMLVLISGAAASFGGTSGFLWLHEWLRGSRIALAETSAPGLEANRGWMALGGLVAIIFIGLLGRGIRV